MAAAAEVGDRVMALRDREMSSAPTVRLGILALLPALTLRFGILVCASLLLIAAGPARADTYFLTVAGLGGEPDYEQRFTELATDLDHIFKAAGPSSHVFTLSGKDATRSNLAAVMGTIAGQAKPEDDFVLTLIGHGTYDGLEYKFNLVGPDISGAGLAQLCGRVASRRQLVVNTSSASGGSLAVLAKRGRAVIAATKSGTEKNATVFARYWVEALQDSRADLDKNDSISALEAFQYATAKTAAFYESQKRLATEHAVFADTGTGAGVRVASTANGAGRLLSSLTLVRFGTERTAAGDPAKRSLLVKKEQLERRIDTLKYQRAALSPQEYKQQLTESLVALAKVQEELDK
jgi:hypothetical protein